MGPDDKDLMAAINDLAAKAKENPAEHMDLKGAANHLAQRFEHRTEAEIEEKMQDVWRVNGLFWRT